MAGYCTLVLYFHSPAARENTAAHSCNNIKPFTFSPIKQYIYTCIVQFTVNYLFKDCCTKLLLSFVERLCQLLCLWMFCQSCVCMHWLSRLSEFSFTARSQLILSRVCCSEPRACLVCTRVCVCVCVCVRGCTSHWAYISINKVVYPHWPVYPLWLVFPAPV